MEHLYVDMGNLPRGSVVEFHLSGTEANVWLMDASTYSRYKRGRRMRAQGGHSKRSPVRMQTDRSGHWYAVADLGGYPGRLGLEAQVLPGAAAPLRSAPNLPADSPLIAFADELPDDAFEDREFDLFISHAAEDKDALVHPLAHALQCRGVVVWYDEFELRVGDSLRRKIDAGPVWHNIAKDELIRQSPSLADRVALSTSALTVEGMADQIAEVVHPGSQSRAA